MTLFLSACTGPLVVVEGSACAPDCQSAGGWVPARADAAAGSQEALADTGPSPDVASGAPIAAACADGAGFEADACITDPFPGSGSPEPCLGGGNVFAIAIDGRPLKKYSGDTWNVQALPERGSFPTMIGMGANRVDPTYHGFGMRIGDVRPLVIGPYEDTVAPDSSGWQRPLTGPSLNASDDSYCTGSGRFHIYEMSLDASMVRSFTATFEQDCDFQGRVYGCVHVQNVSRIQ